MRNRPVKYVDFCNFWVITEYPYFLELAVYFADFFSWGI